MQNYHTWWSAWPSPPSGWMCHMATVQQAHYRWQRVCDARRKATMTSNWWPRPSLLFIIPFCTLISSSTQLQYNHCSLIFSFPLSFYTTSHSKRQTWLDSLSFVMHRCRFPQKDVNKCPFTSDRAQVTRVQAKELAHLSLDLRTNECTGLLDGSAAERLLAGARVDALSSMGEKPWKQHPWSPRCSVKQLNRTRNVFTPKNTQSLLTNGSVWKGGTGLTLKDITF